MEAGGLYTGLTEDPACVTLGAATSVLKVLPALHGKLLLDGPQRVEGPTTASY